MTADMDFATLDFDRCRRRGLPEVIYCPGKTPEHILAIMQALREAGQNVFATRAEPGLYDTLKSGMPDLVYHASARAITLDVVPLPEPAGLVTVVCAGTADLPVADEAALSARRMGARVERVSDVGVAGLHRILPHLPLLRASHAVIVVAGMEGALPSVVGGLIDRPLIAVPTSVGYGTALHGIAALLAMLNTCVPGITVVNIDNGFGAGIAAGMINKAPSEEPPDGGRG